MNGVTQIDGIRSEKIRKELKIKLIQGRIKTQQLRQLEFLSRIDESRKEKAIGEIKLGEKRGKGRSRNVWNMRVERKSGKDYYSTPFDRKVLE